MRPIERGVAPAVYTDYTEAKQDLVNRLGIYCSYCERKIPAKLAVEHIQPKALPQYAHLINEWENFLLGCTNCNSAKSVKEVDPANHYLPDRDNTFYAFQYDPFGMVTPSERLDDAQTQIANDTIGLVNLNPVDPLEFDETTLCSALLRTGQRIEAWTKAEDAAADYAENPSPQLLRSIVSDAMATGFFSIWMAVFEGVQDIRAELIRRHPGTAADCFDAETRPISTRPPNGLAHSGKI